MRRICSWCNTFMSEKCPACGSLNVELRRSINARIWQALTGHRSNPRFYCRACTTNFAAGEGGTTHSVCTNCAIAIMHTRGIHARPK